MSSKEDIQIGCEQKGDWEDKMRPGLQRLLAAWPQHPIGPDWPEGFWARLRLWPLQIPMERTKGPYFKACLHCSNWQMIPYFMPLRSCFFFFSLMLERNMTQLVTNWTSWFWISAFNASATDIPSWVGLICSTPSWGSCAKPFTFLISFDQRSNAERKVDPFHRWEKWREETWQVQGHSAAKQWSQNMNPEPRHSISVLTSHLCP